MCSSKKVINASSECEKYYLLLLLKPVFGAEKLYPNTYLENLFIFRNLREITR